MFYHPNSSEALEATLFLHFRYFFFTEEKGMGLVAGVSVIMFFVLTWFLNYHLNFVSQNMTTNESYKRSSMIVEIKCKMSV